MRTQTIFVFVTFLTILSLLTGLHSAHSGMTDEQYYSQYVDKFIEKCARKDTSYSNSCMPTIQQYGALNCLKASYIAYFKTHIVGQLLEVKADVGRTDYKIDRFINSKFFEVFKVAKGEYEKKI